MKFTTTQIAALALTAALAPIAQAAVAVDANIETNTTKQANTDLTNDGRVEVNAVANLAKSGDYFVTAKGTLGLRLTTDSNQDNTYVDDAWIQFGSSKADMKIGRHEAADLFPLGKDTLVVTAGSVSGYKANTLRGRVTTGALHAVVGVNLSKTRLELGLVTKKDTNAYGLRPTVVYTDGPLTLRAGIESIHTKGATSQTGLGISAGYAVNNMTFNGNFAKNKDLNASSLGLNMVMGDLGLGLIQDKDTQVKHTTNTVYAAYSFPLLNVPGATITPAISNSRSTGVKSVSAVRVRLNYAF